MTPVTCNLAETVNLTACLKAPFVGYTVYAQKAPNLGRVEYAGSTVDAKTIEGYASYIDNGTDQSFLTDQTDPDFGAIGGFYTGTKFMTYALNAAEYSIGYVDHAYGDPDDLTGPGMTIVNVGDGGVTPPSFGVSADGPVDYELIGPSAAGGDRISWFEGRSTTMHFLTSTISTLTREQAFPLEGGETFRDFANHAFSWIYDGSDFWLLTRKHASPFTIVLVRFVPTTVGGAYDYEKFEVTFDDTDLNTASAAYGIEIRTCTADTFIVSFLDYDVFGDVRFIEMSKDGTEYTLYNITGNEAAEAFATTNSLNLTKTAAGAPRLIGWSYESDVPAVGTYDMTCVAGRKQGHVSTQFIRTAPESGTGNLIPSGDMQGGSDVYAPSGNANDGGDHLLWRGGN